MQNDKQQLHTLLSVSLKKQTSAILRDFNEIGFLLKSPSNAMKYAQSANIRLQENIYQDLHKFKKSYGAIIKDLDNVENKDLSNKFVINGILGLNNFAKGIPHFCISLMVQRDGDPYASIILNPITNETFYSEKGQGAIFNKSKIREADNNRQISSNSIVALDKKSLLELKEEDINFNPYVSTCKELEICYLAINKIARCNFSESLNYYHVAPSMLFAMESGMILNYNLEINEKEKIITNFSG